VLRRIEPDDGAPGLRMPSATQSEPIVPAIAQAELETTGLPNDHPTWVRDAIAVSQRARDIVARLKPLVVRIMTVWDHRLRSIVVDDRRVRIDASGSYRADV
jgi:hypothetical protein